VTVVGADGAPPWRRWTGKQLATLLLPRGLYVEADAPDGAALAAGTPSSSSEDVMLSGTVVLFFVLQKVNLGLIPSSYLQLRDRLD
jgi:hypothetical protein